MPTLPIHSSRLTAVALATMWAALSSTPAQAVSVSVSNLVATGQYRFAVDSQPTDVPAYTTPNSVDVLSFPGSIDGSYAGLHSYGDTSGNFGSRSSGAGIYDVSGSFTIGLHIVNDGATAQRVNFGFHITPGYIQTGLVGFGSGQFVEAGISFDIQKSGLGSIWSTAGTLLSDASGTSFSSSQSDPTINLFGGYGTSRTVEGKSFSLDLGVLNAGEAMDLSYQIHSSARGNALDGSATTVPDRVIQVPEQWVDYCSGGGYGYGGGYGNVCGPQLVPAHEVIVPGYTTFAGQLGSSQASSGDPFEISSYDGMAYPTYQTPVLPPGVVVGVSAVPEPASYALLMAGLGLVGAVARRRRPPRG